MFRKSIWSIFCGVECSSLNSGCSPHKQTNKPTMLSFDRAFTLLSFPFIFFSFSNQNVWHWIYSSVCTIYSAFQSFQEMVLPFLKIYLYTFVFVLRMVFWCGLVWCLRVFMCCVFVCAHTAYHARICTTEAIYRASTCAAAKTNGSSSKQYELLFFALFVFLFVSVSLSLCIYKYIYIFLMPFSDFH